MSERVPKKVNVIDDQFMYVNDQAEYGFWLQTTRVEPVGYVESDLRQRIKTGEFGVGSKRSGAYRITDRYGKIIRYDWTVEIPEPIINIASLPSNEGEQL